MKADVLHQSATVFDAHSDVLLRVLDKKFKLGIADDTAQSNLPKLIEGGVNAQIFAICMNPPDLPVATKRALQLLDVFYTELEANSDKMRLATKADDIEAAKSDGTVAAVLSLEGVEPLEGDLGLLRMFYRLGIRAAGLTWNWRNQAADGMYEERCGGGLTTFGVALIEEMNRLGMIVDVAHLSSAGVRDVLATGQAPIIVSHADAKAVFDHFRNLTDEQIEAVAANGGVVCAGFVPVFLGPDAHVSSLDKLLNQIDHMVQVAGEDHVGLGSDFDGMGDSRVIGLEDASKMPAITAGLLKRGYSEEATRKLLGGNLMRLFRQVVG